MLYGYKETLDNRIATIITAAQRVEDYDEWVGVITTQDPRENFEEFYASTFLDHMYRDEFKGFKRPVLAFYHTDEAQRDLFVQQWGVKEVPSAGGRDKQRDMIWRTEKDKKAIAEKAEEEAAKVEGREVIGQSIEELYGLDKEDPWDRRTDEEKAEDAAMKEKIKKLRKEGKMSGDSFGGAQAQRDAREADRAAQEGRVPVASDAGSVRVTDIRGEWDDDGTFTIDNALAHKFKGEVDEEAAKIAQAAHEKAVADQLAGRKIFDPEDFAAVLRGDGSADHLNIKGDKGSEKKRAPIVEPVFSEVATEARKKYQEEQKQLRKAAAAKQKIEDDVKGLEEREKNIFRGADLGGDEDINIADLPEKIRDLLEKLDIKEGILPIKDYPYNSELAGRVLLPSEEIAGSIPEDRWRSSVVAIHNLRVDGTISMGHPFVMVATKTDETLPGWAIYQKLRKVQIKEELPKEDDGTESVVIEVVAEAEDDSGYAGVRKATKESPYKSAIYIVRIR